MWHDVNVAETVECETSASVPPSLPEMDEHFPNDIDGFFDYLLENPVSVKEVNLIHDLIVG